MADTGKSLNQVLAERGERYGSFYDQSVLAMCLKELIRANDNWINLAPDQKNALDNILCKVARIINGDPDYEDNWRDIAGYATLVLQRLEARNDAH